jgi:hypothetical protein
MKRPFIIIAGVIVALGVLIGIYFLFLAPDDASLSVGNPFGDIGSGTVVPSADLPTDGTLSNAGTTLAPRFVKITDGPVAQGSVAFGIELTSEGETTPTPVGTTTASSTATTTLPVTTDTTPDVEVRFIDRASGNVYSYVAHERTLTRISNKTLPGIQRASWTPDGSRAFAQFLASSGGEEHVNTYSLNATNGDGYLLENDLDQATVVGSTTLFTLFSGSTGSVGTLSQTDGSGVRTLFSSVLSSLVVHSTSGNFFATNKASSQIDGYGFEISRNTGSFSRIIGPYRGLTLLPNHTGTSLIYSFTEGGVYKLRVIDTASRTSTALPLATLTQKCVWSSDNRSIYCAVPTNLQGNLPDDWYQGATMFTDRIWKISLTDRVATLVIDPSQLGKVNVDAVSLAVDPAEDILIFTDKHSGALYAYDL